MLQRTMTWMLVASAAAFGACRATTAQCVVGADCASGACDVTGKCVAVVTPDGGADASAIFPPLDASPGPTFDAALGETGVPGCTPNDDGTITRDEVPMQPGLRATYLVAENATWSTAGAQSPDGSRTWDLTGALSGDAPVLFDTESPSGTWWAKDFAGATYSARLAASQDLLGLFEAGDSLLLLGVVSPAGGTGQTELTYATPIPTIKTPLTMGTSWQTTSTVNGTAAGVAAYYTEQYTSQVDARGTMKTPYGTFPVLRVSTVLTRTIGVVPTVIRSYAFVAECFGAVASVTSQNNETNAEFTGDAEVRRLTP
jgi:hypothetical protein